MEVSRRRAAEASRSHSTDRVLVGRGDGRLREEPVRVRTFVLAVRAALGSRAPCSAAWRPLAFDGKEAVPGAGAYVPAGLCPAAGSVTGVWVCGAAWPEGSTCSAAGASEGMGSASVASAVVAGAEARGGRKLSGSR
jgi:hypothetical protein